jgi:hypothetical protein
MNKVQSTIENTISLSKDSDDSISRVQLRRQPELIKCPLDAARARELHCSGKLKRRGEDDPLPIDQFYEDLTLVGLGGIDFEEAVALMKRPKEWERTVDQICAAYPRPAPVLPKAPQKKAVLPENGGFATPARKKRPYLNRKDRFLRRMAKSLGKRRISLTADSYEDLMRDTQISFDFTDEA